MNGLKGRRQFDAVGFGPIHIDQILQVRSLPALETNETCTVHLQPGGSAANVAYALAKLGLSTTFIGVVGNDPQGAELRRSFADVGVNTSWLSSDTLFSTGLRCTFSTSNGQRASVVAAGANDSVTLDTVERTVGALLDCRLVCLTSFWGNDQVGLTRAVIEKVLTSSARPFVALLIDQMCALRGVVDLEPALPGCDFVIVNRNELSLLTQEDDLRRAAQMLFARGARRLVILFGRGELAETLRLRLCEPQVADEGDWRSQVATGQSSALIGSADHWEFVRLPEGCAQAVHLETTGVADAFGAGVLWAVLAGIPEPLWGNVGQTMAWSVLQQVGARKGLLTRSQLFQLYGTLYGNDENALGGL